MRDAGGAAGEEVAEEGQPAATACAVSKSKVTAEVSADAPRTLILPRDLRTSDVKWPHGTTCGAGVVVPTQTVTS